MHATSLMLVVVLAQASPSIGDAQHKAQAKAILGQGMKLYDQGDIAGALEKFQAAYAAFPSPKLMFNIGQANRELHRHIEALEAFEKFLADAPDASSEMMEDARKLTQEDPTFKVHTDPDTGQTLISGMGELHLEILVDRMVREFSVAANVGRPQVAYRETILAAAEGEGKYVRQTGGRGQYGHVFLRVDPLPHPDLNAIAELTKKKSTNKFDAELKLLFRDEIVGGVVPKEYIGPTYQGVREAMESGVLAGYEMNGVSVTLFDGSYHEVDSSEIAFKIAGSLGFKEAVRRAKPVLLEPVMKVEVVVPEEYMGDVLGDLSARRGHIEGMEKRGSTQIIRAKVPLAEMFGYATDLRSRTQGRASYTMHFLRYEQTPAAVSEEVIARVQGRAVVGKWLAQVRGR